MCILARVDSIFYQVLFQYNFHALEEFAPRGETGADAEDRALGGDVTGKTGCRVRTTEAFHKEGEWEKQQGTKTTVQYVWSMCFVKVTSQKLHTYY